MSDKASFLALTMLNSKLFNPNFDRNFKMKTHKRYSERYPLWIWLETITSIDHNYSKPTTWVVYQESQSRCPIAQLFDGLIFFIVLGLTSLLNI